MTTPGTTTTSIEVVPTHVNRNDSPTLLLTMPLSLTSMDTDTLSHGAMVTRVQVPVAQTMLPTDLPHQEPFVPLRPALTPAPTVIPRDLLPLYKKGCNDKWAKNMYQYCHVFNNKVSNVQPVDQNAVLEWMVLGQRMQNDLKETGNKLADEQVLAIAHAYGMMMEDNQKPTSVSDVLQIIARVTWYRQNVDLMRGIIYLIAYGIFRDGSNKWAINEAESWLQARNLEYMAPTATEGEGSRYGKGCVYSLIVQRASDRISKSVQNTMRHAHREFLAVKNRQRDPTSVYRPCRYGIYKFYLGTVIDTSTAEAMNTFRASVQMAIKFNITALQLLTIVHSEYTPNGITPPIVAVQGKIMLFKVAILHPLYMLMVASV